MSKFLEQVEDSMPSDALDNIIDGKRELQRFLFNKGVKNVEVKQFRDEITFTLDDGSKVIVEVKDYKKAISHEDQEGEVSDDELQKIANTIKTVVALPTDRELKKKQGGVAGFGGDPIIKKVRALRQSAGDQIDNITN